MKKFPRTIVFDNLHKGVVITCIGITLYGTFMVGQLGYDYYMRVKPEWKAKQEVLQTELLKEGASETLIDKTYDMKL